MAMQISVLNILNRNGKTECRVSGTESNKDQQLVALTAAGIRETPLGCRMHQSHALGASMLSSVLVFNEIGMTFSSLNSIISQPIIQETSSGKVSLSA